MATLADILLDCASFVPEEQRRRDIAKSASEALAEAGFSSRESLVFAEFADLGTLAKATGPAKAVIRRALAVAKEGAPAPPAADGGSAAKSEAAATVHVNLEERLTALDLAGLPHELKPPSVLVDQMATEVARPPARIARRSANAPCRARRLKRQGVAAPFIACDLRKFLPGWCADEKRATLTVTQFQAAWDRRLLLQLARDDRVTSVAHPRRRYSVAAEVTGQLTRSAAMAHREVVMRVAFKAQAPGPCSLAPHRGLRDPRRRRSAACSSDSFTTKWRVKVGRSEPGPERLVSTSTRRARDASAATAPRHAAPGCEPIL